MELVLSYYREDLNPEGSGEGVLFLQCLRIQGE